MSYADLINALDQFNKSNEDEVSCVIREFAAFIMRIDVRKRFLKERCDRAVASLLALHKQLQWTPDPSKKKEQITLDDFQ